MERSADWLEQARSDLEHARHDLEAEFYEWACFSSQQAAEKAVKAVVQHQGGEAWGHSVADLLEELAGWHEVSADLLDGALELDKSYIPTRYPDAHPSGVPRERYTQSEAQRHINHAERILTFCEDLVADAGS
jgi:HEPN domain-containing protein